MENSANLYKTPHNVASDQGLHCLLTGFSNDQNNQNDQNRIKWQNRPDTPEMTNGQLKIPSVYNGLMVMHDTPAILKSRATAVQLLLPSGKKTSSMLRSLYFKQHNLCSLWFLVT